MKHASEAGASSFLHNYLFSMPLHYFMLPEIVVCLFPFMMDAQNQNIRFEHLSSENGLSQNSVQSIVQDSKGFMWFGTVRGIKQI